MTGFDIMSILAQNDGWAECCRVCRVAFNHGKFTPAGQNALRGPSPMLRWLREQGPAINLGADPFEHVHGLAKLVKDSRGEPYPHRPSEEPWPTMRLLFEALSRARSFVHFASWGISHELVGALKLTSIRVPVYGFISSADREITRELTEFPRETPQLNARVISPKDANFEAPHQKLVIIDGLLAFKGSTNLTKSAIRKVDTGLDVSEIITNYGEVVGFNNRFFAPVWKKITSPDMTEFLMWDDKPPPASASVS